MRNRLDKGRFREITSSILYYSSFIGFGLILGFIIFKPLWDYFNFSRRGVSYCEVSFQTQDRYYAFTIIGFSIFSFILILKFILLIFYSILKGENKKILYVENLLSLIISMIGMPYIFMIPGCIGI